MLINVSEVKAKRCYLKNMRNYRFIDIMYMITLTFITVKNI